MPLKDKAHPMFFVISSLGKYLRQKRIDFQLPYDILWLWKHDQVGNHTVHFLYFLGMGVLYEH